MLSAHKAGRMKNIKETIHNQYKICTVEDSVKTVVGQALIDRFLRGRFLEKKGRGGIKLLHIDNRYIACRKYIHGGLLRAITRDVFFREDRALQELELLLYLQERGFPVVQPYGLIIEKDSVAKRLYILTMFEENATDLLDVINRSTKKERHGIIKRLAQLMWHMETIGIYHPYLHLNNILVTADKEMKFLDFDRAYKKAVTKKDMERMFWRLNRYVEKMQRGKQVKVDLKDKILFLRAYGKVAGFDMAHKMAGKAGLKTLISKIGWFCESLIYGS